MKKGKYKREHKRGLKDITVKETLFTAFLLLMLGVVGYFVFFSSSSISIDDKDLQENSQQALGCNRTEMYPMSPEFSRAISIIEQRTGDESFMGDFKNCLNIQYKDLKTEGIDAEGVFLFDNSISSPDNLVMYVDSSYKESDDYLTAILLVHEITHAMQFYKGTDKSCVEKEVSAFYNEMVLYAKLNKGERDALSARMYNPLDYPSSTPQIRALEDLIDLFLVANRDCNGEVQCSLDEGRNSIRNMIIGSPFYQKQCNL